MSHDCVTYKVTVILVTYGIFPPLGNAAESLTDCTTDQQSCHHGAPVDLDHLQFILLRDQTNFRSHMQIIGYVKGHLSHIPVKITL